MKSMISPIKLRWSSTVSDSEQLAQRIVTLAQDKKAGEIISMDVRGLSPVTDFFIIATGTVDIHVKAIAEHVLGELKSERIVPLNVEGMDNLRWVLMDFVDVVFHLFLPEARDFYSIERLWGEAVTERYDEV